MNTSKPATTHAYPTPPVPSKPVQVEAKAQQIHHELDQRQLELRRLKEALVEATRRLDERTEQLVAMQNVIEQKLAQQAGYVEMTSRRLQKQVTELHRDEQAITQRIEAAARKIFADLADQMATNADQFNMTESPYSLFADDTDDADGHRHAA